MQRLAWVMSFFKIMKIMAIIVVRLHEGSAESKWSFVWLEQHLCRRGGAGHNHSIAIVRTDSRPFVLLAGLCLIQTLAKGLYLIQTLAKGLYVKKLSKWPCPLIGRSHFLPHLTHTHLYFFCVPFRPRNKYSPLLYYVWACPCLSNGWGAIASSCTSLGPKYIFLISC